MAKQISIKQFNAYLESGQIDEAEALLSKMVEKTPEDERSGPFSAPVRLKSKYSSEAAAQDGEETRGRIAIPLANRLSRAIRNVRFQLKTAGGFDGDIFVSVGDSWFQYPVILDDIIDELSRDNDKAVYSLGAAGDQLESMVNLREYMPAIAETGAKYLLLSGGGNDLLEDGALEGYLRDFQDGAEPSNLIDHDALDQKLIQIRNLYLTIVDDVARHHPNVQIFGHAYDIPFPDKNGRWLGTPFQNRNIPFDVGRQIMEIIFGKFSDVLSSLAVSYSNFSFVDLHGVASETKKNWHDELHPKNVGFGRVANKFREQIQQFSESEIVAETDEDTSFIPQSTFSQFSSISEKYSIISNGVTSLSSFNERDKMARKIIDYETRRDSNGRLVVYHLHSDDGGGAYEVAGINERYHKEEADRLVSLIEAGRYVEAENYAVEFIASYTDRADRWCKIPAVEFYIRDSIFNRGPGGAAWIVQHAAGVSPDGVVGPITRAAIAREEDSPLDFLKKLRASREIYERKRRDESSRFWRGLVNRWNNALDFALTFLPSTDGPVAYTNPIATPETNTNNDAFEDRILNCSESQESENDWHYDDAEDAEVVRALYFPEELDLRRDWWPVGDQGRTGSCVGWAAADSVLRWHFVKAGRLSDTNRLSVRFAWVAAKETDEFRRRPTTFIEDAGTSLKSALDVARKLGAVTENVLPFDRSQVYVGTVKSFYTRAAKLRINSYINLESDLQSWRSWLYQNGPILTRLNVDSNFMNARATNGNLDQYDYGSASGGHAVALVGYTSDGFIIRNSWSENWGENGFAFASNDYAHAAFTEAYGVTI